MHRHVLVPFLKSFVLWDVVEVVPADHDTSLHLHPDHNSIKDAPSDVNVAGEGALLVNVGTMLSLQKKNPMNQVYMKVLQSPTIKLCFQSSLVCAKPIFRIRKQ